MTDLIIKNAQLAGRKQLVDIHVKGAVITDIADSKNKADDNETIIHKIYNAKGHFVCTGFYESHIHLDKACILDRCSVTEGTLKEAVNETVSIGFC